jgi:hypothetical protein
LSDHIDNAAFRLHRFIVPHGADKFALDKRCQFARVGLEVDKIQMRIGPKDVSRARNLDDLTDVLRLNPYPDGTFLEVALT